MAYLNDFKVEQNNHRKYLKKYQINPELLRKTNHNKNLYIPVNNNNPLKIKIDEQQSVDDHIDDIIDQVVNGAGEIPYNSDSDDCKKIFILFLNFLFSFIYVNQRHVSISCFF